ncbi:hypothetical protein KXV22_006300 [Aspergillus fumigatus]|nr:hypothetical protein CNMCM8686_003981 [Aspergillus fumigatus]KAH1296591.1 hypothetical protein KXX11_007808 [Aspergillus fumigatus]KAH1341945.1 hypothetical protein KXX67_006855 [Aspergillus fumigatus]KAH1353336.1 hypothetical protein KXX14_001057 [Aspergillus fumigatus]KAH1568838.1 hypothetical protein KXX17_001703 [Aspergillus fumigatus]
MPPSTVFSYWRREHRRASAPPVSSSGQVSSRGKSNGNRPQLPVIQHTPILATTVEESSPCPDTLTPLTSSEYSPADGDTDKGLGVGSTVSTDAPSSAATNLAVPSSTSDKQARPHSSPEDREKNLDLTAQPNSSQVSITASRPEYGDSDSSKPNSPFRLSFGKGLLNSQNQSFDVNIKRSSTPVLTCTADKSNTMHKEYRPEGSSYRRQPDRDVSTEHTSHKSGKAMLHLLNPMSLLARRRSSQFAGHRAEDISIGARNVVPAIPDDYDPRIRGNIIHDFSAPRPRRNLSTAPVLLQDAANQYSPYNTPQTENGSHPHGRDAVVQSSEHRKKHSEYSPVFKEHFEDDQNVLQVDSKAYLQSSLLTNPSVRSNDQSVPVFARRLPSRLPDHEENPEESISHQSEPQERPQPKEQPAAQQDSDTIEIIPQQQPGLPKHFKSNASRFSFDMNGVESSAQEKLLEEKHKEKEAARRAKAQLEDREYSDVEDDYDNDLLDDFDGLEERIPGVNTDAEEDEFSGFSGPGAALTTSWHAPGLSPVVASPMSAPGLGPAVDINLQLDQGGAPHVSDISVTEDAVAAFPPTTNLSETAAVGCAMQAGARSSTSQLIDEDDDLYFDDGEFGDLAVDAGGETFDESIFDDESSHLYARKTAVVPAPPVEPGTTDQMEDKSRSGEAPEPPSLSPKLDQTDGLKHAPSAASDFRDRAVTRYGGLDPEMTHNLTTTKSHGGVLSEHNLEVLHNALEKAANETAHMDRFKRTTSASERSLGQDSTARTNQTMDSYSGLVSDDSHLSQAMDAMGFEEVFDDFNYDDDDAFYDDPIIAAANAEALENDDEGFYGQEFGFYAHAHGGCSSELTNGGYFGPRGVEGISRNHSSRGKFREPSLTPITERSEWSTRNSVISLTAHGAAHSNSAISGPGLAQLVDMGTMDDEMSLSALLKLRRGAWGGSNGSLRSSSGSPPPHHHSSSNRASFTAFSDVSPTVYTVPPDYLFGGPSAAESPTMIPTNGDATHQSLSGEAESQIYPEETVPK